MSIVFTPNVIISNNLDKLERVINRNSKIINFDEMQEEDNIFFISPKNNKYLTHFEFSLGFPDSNATKLTVKFLDIDNQFQNKFFTNKVLEDMLAHIISNSQDYFGNRDKEINNLLAQEQKLYFCFGIGSDIKNWSGIYTGVIITANLNIQHGVREYIFDVFPSNSYLFRSRLPADKTGPDPYKYASIGNANIKSVGRYNIPGGVENFKPPKVSENAQKIILEVYKDYIKTITNNPNIIIVLPDITKGFKEFYDKEYNKKKYEVYENGMRPQKTIDAALADLFLDVMKQNFKIKICDTDSAEEANKLVREIAKPQITDVGGPGTVDIKTEVKRNFFGKPTTKLQGFVSLIYSESKEVGSSENAANKSDTNIPNWREPFQYLENGIKNLIPGFAGSVICFEESNTEIIKYWKEQGIIENAGSPCIVFGIDQMIYDFVYSNQALNLDSAITEFKSKYEFWKDDPLKKVVTVANYKEKMFNLLYNNRNNSCFGEQTNIDELMLDSKPLESSILVDGINLAKKFDIPLFTYNLFNSNVLEVAIDLNQNYWTSIQLAVRDNRSRYLANNIVQNFDNIETAMLGHPFTPGELKKIIDGIEEDISKLSADAKQKLGDKFSKAEIEIIKTTRSPSLGKLKPYVSLLNEQNITKLHASIAAKLADELGDGKKLRGVNPEALFSVASFIIGMNRVKDSKANSLIGNVAIPSVIGPSSESIQGEIFKYMMDNFLVLQLRTLPYFHLSGWNVVSMPAFVFGKRNNFIDPTNSNPANFDKSNQNEFYNGLYTIAGFRHVITTKEAYSEFKLLRNTVSLTDASTLNNKTIEANEEQLNAIRDDLNYNLKESNNLESQLGLSYLKGSG